MDCTSTDSALAIEYLRNNGWDLDLALGEFWEAAHPASTDDELSSLASKVADWDDPKESEAAADEEEEEGDEGSATSVGGSAKVCFLSF